MEHIDYLVSLLVRKLIQQETYKEVTKEVYNKGIYGPLWYIILSREINFVEWTNGTEGQQSRNIKS